MDTTKHDYSTLEVDTRQDANLPERVPEEFPEAYVVPNKHDYPYPVAAWSENQEQQDAVPPRRSRKWLWIIVGAVVLVVIAIVVGCVVGLVVVPNSHK